MITKSIMKWKHKVEWFKYLSLNLVKEINRIHSYKDWMRQSEKFYLIRWVKFVDQTSQDKNRLCGSQTKWQTSHIDQMSKS